MPRFLKDSEFTEVFNDINDVFEKHQLRNLEKEIIIVSMLISLKVKSRKDLTQKIFKDAKGIFPQVFGGMG